MIFNFLCRAGFPHYLRIFSRFFRFTKSGNKGQWHFAGNHYYHEILSGQCHLYSNLFQLSLASILCSQQAYFPALSPSLSLCLFLSLSLSLSLYSQSLQYLILSRASVFVQKSIMHNKEKQSHFSVILKIIKIDKEIKQLATSCHEACNRCSISRLKI